MVSAVPGHYVDGRLIADAGMQINSGDAAMWILVGVTVTAPVWLDLFKMGYENLKLNYKIKY